MAGYTYDIAIKDFAAGALSKLKKESISTEGAIKKLTRGISQGSKTAVPSINNLRVTLEKMRQKRDDSFSVDRIRKFNTVIRRTEHQLKKLENLPPLSFSQKIRNIGRSASSTILPIGGLAAGVAAVGAVFRSVILVGSGFEKEMSNVKALTGASGEEFTALSGVAKKLGETTVFSARQAAEGMSFLAQAGFKTQQIIKALPATLNLASAGGLDLGRSADIASNVLSGFGLEAVQTGRVADVMTKAITSSNVNVSELGESMKFFAPTAKTLGIGLEESTAVIGLLGNSGLKGSIATQSLGSSLTRLAAGGGKVSKTLKSLGVSLFQDGKFIGLAETIGKLEVAFEGMNEQQKTAHLTSLFGAEAFKNVAVLMDSGSEKIKEYTDQLIRSRGIAEKIAEVKQENLSGAFTQLKSAVSGLGISIFEVIKNPLTKLTKSMTKITGGLSSVVSWLKKNSVWIKTLGAGILTYVAVSKLATNWTRLLSVAKRTWSAVTTALTAKQWALNSAMLANPAVAITAAVVALGAAIYVYAKSVKNVSAAQQAQLDVARKLKEATVDEKVEAESLISVFMNHESTNEQRTASYNKLLGLYPSILGKYKTEKEALLGIDIIQEKIISNIERKAKAEVAADELKSAYKNLEKVKQATPGVWEVLGRNALQSINPWADDAATRYFKQVEKAKERVSSLKGILRKATADALGDKTSNDVTLNKTQNSKIDNEVISNVANSVVTGGKRQQIFNINIEKVLEMGDQIISDGKVEADDLVDTVIDGLTRRLHGTVRTLTS